MSALKKTFFFFSLIFLAVFVGCSENEKGVTYVTIWHQKNNDQQVFLEKIIEEYNTLNPKVKVSALARPVEEVRNIFLIAAAAGKGPDIIYSAQDNIGIFELTKTIRSLDGLFPEEFFEQYTELGVTSWKGKRWLLADKVGDLLMIVYNKELVPHPPKTFKELIELGMELTRDFDGDGKIDQYGLTWYYQEPFWFIPFLSAFDAWPIDENAEPNLDNEKTVKALQFILDLRDKYKVIPKESDYNTADALFKEGRAAMIINGPWSWAGYKIPKKAMIAPMPKNSKTGLWCGPIVSAVGFSININVPDEKLPIVCDVLKYLTSKETQIRMVKELLTLPSRKDVILHPVVQGNEVMVTALEQMKHARPMPVHPRMRQIWDGMRGGYQLIMNGRVTAEEGAKIMQKESEKLIKDTQL